MGIDMSDVRYIEALVHIKSVFSFERFDGRRTRAETEDCWDTG